MHVVARVDGDGRRRVRHCASHGVVLIELSRGGAELDVIVSEGDRRARGLRVVHSHRRGHRDLQYLHGTRARLPERRQRERPRGRHANAVTARQPLLVPFLVTVQLVAAHAHRAQRIAIFGDGARRRRRGGEDRAAACDGVCVHQAEVVSGLLHQHDAAGAPVEPRSLGGPANRSLFAEPAEGAQVGAREIVDDMVVRAEVLRPLDGRRHVGRVGRGAGRHRELHRTDDRARDGVLAVR